MPSAEDAIRAREAATAAEAHALHALERDTDIDQLSSKIRHAIPQVLRGLEAQGFPEGRLLTVFAPPRGLRKRRVPQEIAGWQIVSFDTSDTSYSVFFLSDGRFISYGSGGPSPGVHPYATSLDEIISPLNKDRDRVRVQLLELWNGRRGGSRFSADACGMKRLMDCYGHK